MPDVVSAVYGRLTDEAGGLGACGWRGPLVVTDGQVAFFFLGDVQAEDGVQPVQQAARSAMSTSSGGPVPISSRSWPRRMIWWAISGWTRLIVAVASLPNSRFRAG
jgi:hypothetical protein